MPADRPPITLYRLQACPFCERVVRVLQEHDVPYRSRFVDAMHSDRDAVKRLVGLRTVPAIHDEITGARMAESANIVDYVETTYGDGEGTAETTDGDGDVAAETTDGDGDVAAETTDGDGGSA
jgi:glutathione S-transferase